MNPNSPRPGHLFFTPRTPWGTRAGQQTFRQHQRASEDSKTSEKLALDQINERGEDQRRMDQNHVPRSLQGQITPERAVEIIHPPTKPLTQSTSAGATGAAPAHGPQQASSASATPGVLQYTAPSVLTPAEADKAWMKKEPGKHWYDNPLQFKKWEIIPSVHPQGAGVELKRKW